MAVSGRTSPPVTGCLTDQELLVSQDVQHSVLESHAKEAAVTERHVRQSVALQVKYEQENRIALAAKEYKAAFEKAKAHMKALKDGADGEANAEADAAADALAGLSAGADKEKP